MADETINTTLITDKLQRILYELMRDRRNDKLPAPPRLVFDLDQADSAFFVEALRRIKTMHEEQAMEFASVVSHRTQEPIIRVNWGEMEGVWQPHQAMLVASQIIEITQAAITDAFLFTFLVENGNTQQSAWMLLGRFRQYREQLAALRMPQPKEAEPEDRKPPGGEMGEVTGPKAPPDEEQLT